MNNTTRRILARTYAELPPLTRFGGWLTSLAETPALAGGPAVVLAILAVYLAWRRGPAAMRRSRGDDA